MHDVYKKNVKKSKIAWQDSACLIKSKLFINPMEEKHSSIGVFHVF